MRYCVNSKCSNPENPDFTEICQDCNSGLLLSGRFRPIEMVGKGGFGRIFKAIDEHDIDGGKCLIKQFCPEQGNTNNVPINRNPRTLLPGYQTQSDLEEIHKKEIKNLARLKHPQNNNYSQPENIEDNYGQLRNYLETKNWKSADKETYEIILKISEKKAQSRGSISSNELQNLSCDDLKTMDEIWRISSDGKLGFSSQQRIYEESGLNWQKMYAKVGWGRLENGQLINTVESELDWETRRRVYKKDKTPNFSNPSPGHLPITKDIVRGVAFPQFAEICQF